MTDPNDPFHRLTPLDQSTLKLPWEAATAVLEATWRFLLGSGDVSVLSTKHQQTVIVAALVRRAVVITEGIFRLLRGGLIEPAFGLYRTLLEIHFTLKLVFAPLPHIFLNKSRKLLRSPLLNQAAPAIGDQRERQDQRLA
jgi:hypothetical protein